MSTNDVTARLKITGQSQFSRATQDAEDDVGRIGKGFSLAGDKAKKFGSMAKAGIAGAAAAVAAVGGVAIMAGFSKAMDAEVGQDKLAAQLGLNEVDAKRLGGVSGRIYAGAWGESLEEVQASVGSVVSSIAGMRKASTADVEALTIKALDFATAFDTDVATSTKTVGLLMKNGLAKDAAEAYDLLTKTFQQVPAAMREELPDIVNEYGVNFKALGFTGSQTFAVLAEAAKGGSIELDKTGDVLKEFGLLSTDMSTSSVDAYKTLGLNAEQMANAILGGGTKAADATSLIASKLLDIEDSAKRANTAISLFGSPLEDLGVNNIPQFLGALAKGNKGLDGFAGATDKMGATLNDNAKTNITSFRRTIESKFTTYLGNKVIPMVTGLSRKLGPGLAKVFGWLGKLVPVAKELASSYLEGWVKQVSAGFRSFNKSLERNKPMLKAFGGAIAMVVKEYGPGFYKFLGWVNSTGLRMLVTALGWGIDGVRLLGNAFVTLARGALTALDKILGGAAKAFGWVPGVGDKLKAANVAFDVFAADANAALDSIDKTLNIGVETQDAKDKFRDLAGYGTSMLAPFMPDLRIPNAGVVAPEYAAGAGQTVPRPEQPAGRSANPGGAAPTRIVLNGREMGREMRKGDDRQRLWR